MEEALLNCETLGSKGNPIVMLHGWGQSLEDLRPLAKILSRSTQVHLIDLPGFGKSPPPPSTWSSFDYADALLKYLDANQIKQVDLFGHSFGGKVSISFAIRYPERVRKLILANSAGLKRHSTIKRKCRLLGIKLAGRGLKYVDRLFKAHYFDSFAARFGSADYRNAGAMRPILVKSVNEDLSNRLPQIKAPTLMMWGEEDQETPLEVAYRMQNLIPNATLMRFPHKGHHVFQDIGAHLCAYHIFPFLAQDSTRNE